MKNSINYYTREERNGMTLLLTMVMLFTVFVFLQNHKAATSITMHVRVETSMPLNNKENAKSNFASIENSSEYSHTNKTEPVFSFKTKKNEYKHYSKPVDQDSMTHQKSKKSVAMNTHPSHTNEKRAFTNKKFQHYKRKESQKILLSASKQEEWQKLRGIGKVFSSRIIKYKNWLGGFHTVSQLKEVYGMTDSLYQTLVPYVIKDVKINYININTCSVKQLGKHPYVNWKDAKKIIAYRKQHGPYKTIQDLDKIIGLDEEKIAKFKPYISFDNHLDISVSNNDMYAQNK